ncbi:sulfatase family protein [Mycobacterium ulcerans str. Harvey]|uniref:Sulfatase family protein n=1 Tax=Mycobacterium ulcerans str. Harvey TaxID=1299332 RepID=A0ABN0R6P5_MYCUL|nr:sulfatase family protein [Mycobacterium ulcerans str. Harvey]
MVGQVPGKFDDGWDALREKTLNRQKELGVVSDGAELTKRHDEIPAWDDMPDEPKPVLARQMEIYAGFLEQTDHEVGRLVGAIDDLGVLDDTLIYYIIGDNGASAEGTINGCFNEMTTLNGLPGIETTEFLLSKTDDFGTPDAYNHYAVGWAHALCAPYQWTKQVASHWGGTRNGTVVHWPNGLTEQGGMRDQFHPVIDVAPTILEAAGLPAPHSVNGIAQAPLEGVSMMSTLRDAAAPETHEVQYFEMMGNRGIYFQGWTAVTKHRTPWKADAPPPFDDDVWELYAPGDWTQAHNLATQNPAKLAELQRLWLIEATKYNVVPLDDRGFERINPDIAGRPQLVRGNSQLLFDGMRVSEWCVLTIKNKSHSVTAEVEVPTGGASGLLITQGGSAGAGRCTPTRAGSSTATTSSASTTTWWPRPSRSPPASTRSGWNSATTAAGWAGAAMSRFSTTAKRWARDGSSAPNPWRFPPMRPVTSGATPDRPPRPTTALPATPSAAPSPGCRSISVQTAMTI